MHETTSELFITPLYKLLFGEEANYMFKRAKEKIIRVADQFPIQEGTFIRFFGSYKPPHALPKFVIDKLMLQEVCYQMTTGLSKTLNKGKKKPQPSLPLTTGAYTIDIFQEVEVEAEEMKGFYFVNLSHHRYDPKGMVAAHCMK